MRNKTIQLNNKFLLKAVESKTPNAMAFCDLISNFEKTIINNRKNQYF